MTRVALFLVLVLSMAGCMAKGTIPAKPIEPLLRRVCQRHDESVKADETLTKGQKEQRLLDSEILLMNLDAALEGSVSESRQELRGRHPGKHHGPDGPLRHEHCRLDAPWH